jgi:hypothetical protein
VQLRKRGVKPITVNTYMTAPERLRATGGLLASPALRVLQAGSGVFASRALKGQFFLGLHTPTVRH